jgi:hypothetical protein
LRVEASVLWRLDRLPADMAEAIRAAAPDAQGRREAGSAPTVRANIEVCCAISAPCSADSR